MDFSLVGLNQYEAKAYGALVRLGKSSAAMISKESGVPYSRIYDVLALLEKKGLVHVVPDKTKNYVPSSPENLHKIIVERKQELEKLEKEATALKKVYETEAGQPVQVAQGKQNFYRIFKSRPAMRVFDYSIRYVAEFYPEWVRHMKEKKKRGIDVKMLARVDAETKSNIKKWLKIQPAIREMKNDGVALSICDTGVVIGLITSNTSLLIQDKAFIKMMKELFLAKYEKAQIIRL
ncbi:helix-turn-helix domain-containing protein [Candidatus Woesearchaeota archaeon]|nr:helix-turn-helix domain-containing protein [Candidatus Woesearchaeota archaeon]